MGVLVALAAVAVSGAPLVPRADPGVDPQEGAIRQVALDYAEGFYEGSPERVARSVHPALLKRGLLPPGRSQRFLQSMSAEALIDAAARGDEKLPPAERQLDFALLDRHDEAASARIFTARFDDYLLLARQDGRWRIVSVLWQVPPLPRGPGKDLRGVRDTVLGFFEAMVAMDATRLRPLVHPELVCRSLRPGARGDLVLDDVNVDRLLGELQRMPAESSFSLQVLDLQDRIASVSVVQPHRRSYLHLARQDGRWRLVNMLSR